jgi:hypothetical protein
MERITRTAGFCLCPWRSGLRSQGPAERQFRNWQKRRSRTVPSTWRCHAQVLSRVCYRDRVISAAPSELANKEVAESPHGLAPCDLISRPRCGVHRCRAGHTIDRANNGGRPFGCRAATKVDRSVICTDDVRNQGRPGRCDKAADSMLSKIDDYPPFADTLHIIRPGPASHRSIARQGDERRASFRLTRRTARTCAHSPGSGPRAFNRPIC